MAEPHAKPIDQNNPAWDALVAMVLVILPLAVLILLGLNGLAKIPILWTPADGHAEAHAPAAAAPAGEPAPAAGH